MRPLSTRPLQAFVLYLEIVPGFQALLKGFRMYQRPISKSAMLDPTKPIGDCSPEELVAVLMLKPAFDQFDPKQDYPISTLIKSVGKVLSWDHPYRKMLKNL